MGIGHTRWAPRGAVTEQNAHPHADVTGRVRIVLNGIIENYFDLREHLAADGVSFSSDTDAEIVAHPPRPDSRAERRPTTKPAKTVTVQ